MNLTDRPHLLIIILTIIVLVIESLTIAYLYETAFKQQREQLMATARSQASLISAVALFNTKHNKHVPNGGSTGTTLNQIRDAFRKLYRG